MPAVAKPTTEPTKQKKRKKSKVKRKPRKLNLKGWLKTPEDWAKFDAWVRVNSVPRKIPEPEPIIRKAVPLRRLKKRLKVISKPSIRPVTQCVERKMTRNIRCAKASRRTKELAFPNIRISPDQCVEPGVKQSALHYRATKSIIRLSQPKVVPCSDVCRSQYGISRAALKRKTTDKDDELARPSKRRKLDDECEETEEKCEKEGKLSPWMEFLAIPGYRVLMNQETERAENWRQQIIDEAEPRGKQAYEEQMKRRKELKQREEQERREQEERERKEYEQCEKEQRDREIREAKVRLKCTRREGGDDQDDAEEGEENEEDEDVENGDEGTIEEEDKKSKSVAISEPQGEPQEETEEEREAREKRKMEKNAWRFEALGTCKEFPPKITEAALNYEATPAIENLAQPKKYGKSTCKDPYQISEGAKSAQASPATEALAKPKYPVDPVERPPPREKDEFGMPIFPKPAYGKVLPEPEPRSETKCKTEEEKEEERKQKEQEKEQQKKQRPIDKIANEPTIDPTFDSHGAKKQRKERERAAQRKAELEAADKEKVDKEVADAESADDEAGEEEEEEA